MLCYKDRIFCPFFGDCKNGETCPRALTDKVIASAKEWHGLRKGEPPIDQYASAPECFCSKRQLDLF